MNKRKTIPGLKKLESFLAKKLVFLVLLSVLIAGVFLRNEISIVILVSMLVLYLGKTQFLGISSLVLIFVSAVLLLAEREELSEKAVTYGLTTFSVILIVQIFQYFFKR